jgi:hypothetical protein
MVIPLLGSHSSLLVLPANKDGYPLPKWQGRTKIVCLVLLFNLFLDRFSERCQFKCSFFVHEVSPFADLYLGDMIHATRAVAQARKKFLCWLAV